jgi:hypothetical protein
MADDIKVEIDRLKVRINDMLRRVPASVNGGSYDVAVAYKKTAAQAYKLVTASAPKFIALQQVCNQLSTYR